MITLKNKNKLSKLKIIFIGIPYSLISESIFNSLVNISKSESSYIDIKAAVDSRTFKEKRNLIAVVRSLLGTFGLFGVQSFVKQAKKLKIPVIAAEDINNQAIIQDIKKFEPDLILVAGCNQIIKNNFLKVFPNKIVNFHWSLLPKYPGRGAIIRALLNMDKVVEITFHLMCEEVDKGPILFQREISITPEIESVESLTYKLIKLGADSLAEFLFLLYHKKLCPRAQNSNEKPLKSKDILKLMFVDWTLSKLDLQRRIEIFKRLKLKKYKYIWVTELKIIESLEIPENNIDVSTVLRINFKGIYVKGKDYVVLIRKLNYVPSFIIVLFTYLLKRPIKKGELLF